MNFQNYLFNRLLPISKSSFFLFGPRGSGKSTWVKKNYTNSLYIDLLLPKMGLLQSERQ